MKRTFAAIVFIFVATVATSHVLLAIRRLPSPQQVRAAYVSEERAIVDRQGQVIDEVPGDLSVRRLNWINPQKLTPIFRAAMRQAEASPLSWRLARRLEPRPQRWLATAVALEMAWSSTAIEEALVNLSFYRPHLQGVAAASWALFDREPSTLTPAEAAALAALTANPKAQIAQVRDSACALLMRLEEGEECALLTVGHLAYVEESSRARPFMRLAPHVAKHLVGIRSEGNLVRSTLDRQIQWLAVHALIRADKAPSAALVLENATGNVLAYAVDGDGDEIVAPHAAGSMLTPFLYAQALDEHIVTPTTSLAAGWHQWVSAARALRSGAPLPAARVLDLVGADRLKLTLRRFGFIGEIEGGPSLVTGAASVRLLDVANAYRTLANDGVWRSLRFSPDGMSDEAPRPVVSPAAAFIVKTALTRSAHPWVVVRDSGEDWSVVMSEHYTVAVVGVGNGVAQQILAGLHDADSQAPQAPPVGVEQSEGDWFMVGTVDSPQGPVQVASHFSYPQNRERIDWDDKQKIFIQVALPQADQNVYLNGRRLGQAQPYLPWTPESGAFTLELREASGKVIDRVRFEVRGRRFARRG